jgi:hypothetical protein
MECTNNLKQIGLGAHGYHDVHRYFPTGIKTTNYIGALAYLLPYIEQDNVFKLFSQSGSFKNGTAVWWGDGATWTAARSKIPIFLCPADDADSRPWSWAYIYTSGLTVYGGYFASSYGLGPTNYLPCAGIIGDAGGNASWAPYKGIFFTNSKINLPQITGQDGTSNTLMFGESSGDKYSLGTASHFTWMGAGGMPTYWGTAPFGNSNGRQFTTWHQYGSTAHTNIVNFCFGDGSIRPVRGDYAAGAAGAWRAASGVSDGVSFNINDL